MAVFSLYTRILSSKNTMFAIASNEKPVEGSGCFTGALSALRLAVARLGAGRVQ